MNYLEKLDLIFDLLLDENTYSKYGIDKQAKYWKMGTSFWTLLDRFNNKIKNIEINDYMISKLEKNYKTIEGNNDGYNLFISNNNVTPIIKSKKAAGINTLGQYIRILYAFGLIVIEKKYKSAKEIIERQIKLKVVHNIKNLIKTENRLNLIKKIIVEGFFSNLEDKRNISYSIILEYLFKKKI